MRRVEFVIEMGFVDKSVLLQSKPTNSRHSMGWKHISPPKPADFSAMGAGRFLLHPVFALPLDLCKLSLGRR